MKYFFLKFKVESNSDCTQFHYQVNQIPEQNVEKDLPYIIESTTKTMCGNSCGKKIPSEKLQNKIKYSFYNGAVIASFVCQQEISKTDYDVLTKFI